MFQQFGLIFDDFQFSFESSEMLSSCDLIPKSIRKLFPFFIFSIKVNWEYLCRILPFELYVVGILWRIRHFLFSRKNKENLLKNIKIQLDNEFVSSKKQSTTFERLLKAFAISPSRKSRRLRQFATNVLPLWLNIKQYQMQIFKSWFLSGSVKFQTVTLQTLHIASRQRMAERNEARNGAVFFRRMSDRQCVSYGQYETCPRPP